MLFFFLKYNIITSHASMSKYKKVREKKTK